MSSSFLTDLMKLLSDFGALLRPFVRKSSLATICDVESLDWYIRLKIHFVHTHVTNIISLEVYICKFSIMRRDICRSGSNSDVIRGEDSSCPPSQRASC